jgi:hypothetical protein
MAIPKIGRIRTFLLVGIVLTGFAILIMLKTGWPSRFRSYFVVTHANMTDIFGVLPIPGYAHLSDFQSYSSDLCPLCNFTVRNMKSNSSPRDLILASTFGTTTNIIPFTRSLRSTGCRATFVLFVDSVALQSMNDDLIALLKNCGCTIIPIPPDADSKQIRREITRLATFYHFLSDRSGLFDRVLMVSPRGTIFQGDPFHKSIDLDFVWISEESESCDGAQMRGTPCFTTDVDSRILDRSTLQEFRACAWEHSAHAKIPVYFPEIYEEDFTCGFTQYAFG